MAETDNFSEINENFDTIKTLLNSIRAQGILNTSDVDKLLTGINTKLEKINTEEDIDLIKAFLSELKQNLDERHNVLISKFGAIESLFSNLLKNSADALKSGEVKELFDIVATNLSVFSREVVSQKETLNDITLRLDAMRADDSQKKDIIKNISVLKTDLEHLNNGFDSIVLSLNENFKTVVKTIGGIDQSESINQFGKEISDVVNSSNTILSALQLLDKKNAQIEDSLSKLATQDDINSTKRDISELSIQSRQIADSVDSLSEKSYKLDNLSEKIDASVNIIAGLKAVITDSDNAVKDGIFEKLDSLEAVVKSVSTVGEFENFKQSLETVFADIKNGSAEIDRIVSSAMNEVRRISEDIRALDVNANFQGLTSDVAKACEDIKEQVVRETDKLSQLSEVNVTRALNDITSNAETLNSRLKETHNALAGLCEKSFNDVMDNIAGLKSIVSQIDENNVSANNAIFSNITDRLTIFENSLKTSLDRQEDYVSNSSADMANQISGLKDLSGQIDYKLDASIIELNNSKKEFDSLKSTVQSVLDLDFVSTVKDLRVDLYAVKQDLAAAVEGQTGDLSEKLSNDLFGKYELLISKLDNIEDEIKHVQYKNLEELKSGLDSIASSIVDVISYVSANKENNIEGFDSKLNDIAEIVKDSNLNYVENVRDIVEVIRTQVENNLKQIEESSSVKLNNISNDFANNTNAIREDIKNSFNKLVEVQNNFDEIKEALNINNITLNNNVEGILTSTDSIKSDFEAKLTALKNALIERISEYKNEFTCENADKISEIKFNSENLHAKSIQNACELNEQLKQDLANIINNLSESVNNIVSQLADTTLKIEKSGSDAINYISNDFKNDVQTSVDKLNRTLSDNAEDLDTKVANVVNGFNNLNSTVDNLTKETTASLTSTLAKILENFVSIKAVINSLGDRNADELKQNADEIKQNIESLKSEFSAMDLNLDSDLSKQISIIESNFDSLNNMISDLINKNREMISDTINTEFSKVSNTLNEQIENKFSGYNNQIDCFLNDVKEHAENKFNVIENLQKELSGKIDTRISDTENSLSSSFAEKIELYKEKIEEIFNNSKELSSANYDYIKNKMIEMNASLVDVVNNQGSSTLGQLNNIAVQLKEILNSNAEISKNDYEQLKQNMQNILSEIQQNNRSFTDDIKIHIEDLTSFIDSKFNVQESEVKELFDSISGNLDEISLLAKSIIDEITKKTEPIKDSIKILKEETYDLADKKSYELAVKLDDMVKHILEDSQLKNTVIESRYDDIKADIEQAAMTNQNDISQRALNILDDISSLKDTASNYHNEICRILSEDILPEVSTIDQRFSNILEQNYLNLKTSVDNSNVEVIDELHKASLDLKSSFENLNERLDKDELSRMNVYQAQIKELGTTFNNLTEEAKELTKSELATLADSLIENSRNILEGVERSVNEKIDAICSANNDIAANETKTLESYVNNIMELIESSKQNTIVCKDIINEFLKNELDNVTKNIEKETDVIASDLIEQFEYLKDSLQEELTSLSSRVSDIVSNSVLEAVNDLKSYFDIKSDSSVMNTKFDNLKSDIDETIDAVFENLNKLPDVSLFNNAVADIRTANEVLIESMTNTLNEQFQDFMLNNVSKKIDEKFSLLDKKFIDTIVDKYEEVKILSSQYNTSFENIAGTVNDLINKFGDSKAEIIDGISEKLNVVDNSIQGLHDSFDELKNQIMNKCFDEVFTEAVNNQISGLEALVQEQFKNIEDIKDLCESTLPELSEMNSLVKYDIQQAISELTLRIQAEKDDNSNNNSEQIDITNDLNNLKSEIITQFIKTFNQITFVAEQEEIIDFVQEKHSELITILSHIVTSVGSVEEINDNIVNVDNKIDVIREDIDLINEKITSIMSSDGTVDYVYSLQDLESDIANLRLVLNEMKENDKSSELDTLISSTNNIYELVNIIKTEMPKFNEEFKQEFDSIAGDIVSISTRTNKLLLASDESNKTLQDNLHDFRLVINDLDERTKNLPKDVGIDKIETKLGTLSQMLQNGAKTNQVFNQVFEYLAEWVDRAGEQIASISDKVETLNDIGQIKVMLEDLRAESQDSDNGQELVDALSDIFDKQAKKINSLETKIDKIMVETIMTNENKFDQKAFETTLNSFLTAMETKMSQQQDKIDSLEEKLEEVMSMVDNNDTVQLTKKVGGMDKQIAKLNKNIEKIASHVIEK